MAKALIPVELIERRIYLVRGQKVMTDWDLAEIYGVSTKRLNEQVRRNRRRFPEGFHGAHVNAAGVLVADTVLGDYVGHSLIYSTESL